MEAQKNGLRRTAAALSSNYYRAWVAGVRESERMSRGKGGELMVLLIKATRGSQDVAGKQNRPRH